jgi:hypothetical protein
VVKCLQITGDFIAVETEAFAAHADEQPMATTKIKPLDCSLITRHLSLFLGAVSSVVEHYLDTVGVTGSNPVSRTTFFPQHSPHV